MFSHASVIRERATGLINRSQTNIDISMKKVLLLALITGAFLNLNPNVHAAPMETKEKSAQISMMCKDKTTRIMMIRELMSIKEGKAELAEMLKHDAEFRSMYESQNVNPG